MHSKPNPFGLEHDTIWFRVRQTALDFSATLAVVEDAPPGRENHRRIEPVP
jgi:hypothetical protein